MPSARNTGWQSAGPRPSRPPGFDDAAEPPGYREDPRNGEVTVDMNSKDKRPRLSLLSQGRAGHDSEHYYDGLLPFLRSGPSNSPAPPYPTLVPARRENPAQAKYLPFPHEKDVPLEEALARAPPNRSLETHRRAPRAEGPRPPWHRRINWDAVARSLAAGFGFGCFHPPPR